MVNSRGDKAMPDAGGELGARVESIEHKVDRLSASVDERFEQIDQRFEQVDRRFEQVDRRFAQVDRRLEEIDRRFDGIESVIVELREYVEFANDRLEKKFEARFELIERQVSRIPILESAFARFERKLDRFIDLHLPRTPPDTH